MKNRSSGAITLVVSCVMASLVLLSTVLVRSSTQTCDLTLQRIFYEQRYRACQSLARYGGWLVAMYHEALSSRVVGTCIEHELDAWPKGIKSSHKAVVTIEIQAHYFIVTTKLIGSETVETVTRYSRS